jgi:hypothetical protein
MSATGMEGKSGHFPPFAHQWPRYHRIVACNAGNCAEGALQRNRLVASYTRTSEKIAARHNAG